MIKLYKTVSYLYIHEYRSAGITKVNSIQLTNRETSAAKYLYRLVNLTLPRVYVQPNECIT